MVVDPARQARLLLSDQRGKPGKQERRPRGVKGEKQNAAWIDALPSDLASDEVLGGRTPAHPARPRGGNDPGQLA